MAIALHPIRIRTPGFNFQLSDSAVKTVKNIDLGRKNLDNKMY